MKTTTRVSRFTCALRGPILSALVLAAALAQSPTPTAFPPDEEIRKILADRIGDPKRGLALVVGVIDPQGRRVVTYGSLARGDVRPLDGDTVFEIGSITKVFTSLVLMDMVRKGEVEVTDPVAKFLPATARIPERDGRKITLQDLAVQNSGLPRMPSNFRPKDRANPYADYTAEDLYVFLSGYELTREIGAQFEYSNLGVGLLGHALSLRDGQDYETMMRTRVLDPLGLKSTAVTLSAEMKSRLAVGHLASGEPTTNWDLAVLAGAGALRSTAHDMLTFLAANLSYAKTPLAEAMTAQLGIRRPAGNSEIAYNWMIQTRNGRTLVWHNGGTGGYRSFIGFDPDARTGVIVLTNLSTPAGADDIGRHLLDPSFPLAKISAPKERVAITVDPKTLENYVGAYQLSPRATMTITQEGDQLFGRITGQEKNPLFAEAEGAFFLKVVDAQISFARGPDGKPASATLHQGGRDTVAKRIDPAQPATTETAAAGPAPGAEQALRRTIEELRTGEVNFDLMSPALAELTRKQLPGLQRLVRELGALQSVTFKPTADGVNNFEVKFENGTTEWRIRMETAEKIASVGVRRL